MVVPDESWDAYPVRDVCEVGGGVRAWYSPACNDGDVLVSTKLIDMLISEQQ